MLAAVERRRIHVEIAHVSPCLACKELAQLQVAWTLSVNKRVRHPVRN